MYFVHVSYTMIQQQQQRIFISLGADFGDFFLFLLLKMEKKFSFILSRILKGIKLLMIPISVTLLHLSILMIDWFVRLFVCSFVWLLTNDMDFFLTFLNKFFSLKKPGFKSLLLFCYRNQSRQWKKDTRTVTFFENLLINEWMKIISIFHWSNKELA